MHTGFLISLVSELVAAVVMSRVAPSRGRRAVPWVVLTLVIGWLAFIPLFIVPKKNRNAQTASAPRIA